MTPELSAGAAGFALGFSLILAIGAQNAFVLKQGLRDNHVFWVCLVCAVSDAILIALGTGGFNKLAVHFPLLEPVMRYGGALFLFVYGARSFYNALYAKDGLEAAGENAATLSATLAVCLALTWLNPHVYLDTLALIGSVSTRYAGRHWFFGAGAMAASFVFFFSLGYGARRLRAVFANPMAWRILDGLIGLIMWAIAAGLLAGR